jgi:hypothetical protein
MVPVAVEVDVCAHLLLRRLIYHTDSSKNNRMATSVQQDTRQHLAKARGEQCPSDNLALQHWHHNKMSEAPKHIVPIHVHRYKLPTCSRRQGRFAGKGRPANMQP